MNPIATLVIPEYITRVETSKSRRAKYYRRGRKIPPTLLKKYDFDNDGYLVDNEGVRIVANKKSVGTPGFQALSGNAFYAGYVNPITRSVIVKGLKAFYFPFIREQLTPFPEDSYPLRIEWEMHTVPERQFDMSNFHFYWKYLEDVLRSDVDETGKSVDPIIPDDSYLYVTHPPSPQLCPIQDFEKRKMVFRFYKDNRSCLICPPWSEKQEDK